MNSDKPLFLQRTNRCMVWLLRLGSISWVTPVRIFFAIAPPLLALSIISGSPVITPLIFAYAVAITIYLVNRQNRELETLRPVLTFDERSFELAKHSLSHHARTPMRLAWLVGPVVTIAINYYGPDLTALRNGVSLDIGTAYGLLLATMFWITLCQMLVVFLSNAFTFWKLGVHFTSIDLFETQTLTPFARVAIRNILIFVGGWSLIPIALAQNMAFLTPVMLAFFFTLPFAVVLLVLPMLSVRQRVAAEKEAELARLHEAIHGNRSALKDSPISEDAETITLSNLVIYRDLIEKVNEWPIDYTIVIRLIIYVVIPLLAWIGSAIVGAMVERVL